MQRDEIVEVLKKNICETIDDLDPERIDTTLTMKDLGANSLDIVEIVSRTMRQLRVKIPRSELNSLENIDGLIELLLDAANARTSA